MGHIFTTTEFWAALFGALAAFMLEAMRRWLQDRRANLAAGNEAVFVMAQMYTVAKNAHQQLFEDRAKVVREGTGREPFYFEYLGADVVWNPSDHVQTSKLGFILRSHNPDVLNSVAAVDRAFFNLLGALEAHKRLQVEFQLRSASVVGSGAAPLPVVEAAVGQPICLQLRDLTNFLQNDMPKDAQLIHEIARQLSETLTLIFPTGRVTRFQQVPRRLAGTPVTGVKAAAWRRAVRAVVTWWRTARAPKQPPEDGAKSRQRGQPDAH